MWRLLRRWKVWCNRFRYINSPEAIKSEIYQILNKELFKHPSYCIDALEDFEGVVSYDYDSKGNFEAVLASGTRIKVKVDVIMGVN